MKTDQKERSKVTTTSLSKRVAAGEKLTAVTAYDFTFAHLADCAGIDVVVVGVDIVALLFSFW